MLKVGIVGGSGYVGGELLRLLLGHPEVTIERVTSRSDAGQPVANRHPQLRGVTDLVFEAFSNGNSVGGLDCIFLALPHGESAPLVDALPEGPAVIDLGGDFRLRDAGEFERHYGKAHPAAARIPEFTYGLSELFAQRIAAGRRVACPGCFATAVLLGLAPLVEAAVVEGPVVADAKTGSSGSGASPAANTHHPTRDGSFYAYKPFGHQHVPEIEQALADLGGGAAPELLLQVHSAPMVRGIFASLYCQLRAGVTEAAVGDVFRSRYSGQPLVRLVEGSPNVKWVANSCFADVGWAVSGRRLVVFVSIDNLLKGAAGQAVQNFNLMFGLPPQTGLTAPGGHP